MDGGELRVLQSHVQDEQVMVLMMETFNLALVCFHRVQRLLVHVGVTNGSLKYMHLMLIRRSDVCRAIVSQCTLSSSGAVELCVSVFPMLLRSAVASVSTLFLCTLAVFRFRTHFLRCFLQVYRPRNA